MPKTHKVTITVEVTDEDLEAGEYDLSHGTLPPMSPQELVDYHLERAVKAELHAMRSKLRWSKLPSSATYKPRFLDHPDGRVRDPREGHRDCPTSPTKTCWYDEFTDPCWDFCVFCGDPNERK